MTNKYCKKCKQRIFEASILNKLFPYSTGGNVIFEFEDGLYCDDCGEIKLNKIKNDK